MSSGLYDLLITKSYRRENTLVSIRAHKSRLTLKIQAPHRANLELMISAWGRRAARDGLELKPERMTNISKTYQKRLLC